ncbi:uncharacterized protein LTR77_010307 [Saxophila tyrrhenica]|uniref:t-SNARE coiled-coil homology domain-containing protein n=1 Tax=Saxophila tyrrhenica TaxID=1690608 RepID=A0AAV9NZN4_9PEZI|nr:hypothetical protein LTR77_010307 [Saxophila tyrrhenica]
MADITPTFSTCLKDKGAKPILPTQYDLNKINTFLQEAHSINARIADLTRELRSIRPAYLSTAPPTRRRNQAHESHDQSRRPLTDSEREAIDAQSKQLLRQLNGGITGLKQAEDVRNQTADSVALSKRARGGLGALGRWAAGGAVTAKSPEEEQEEAERKTIAAVRESIILYLQRKLEEAGRVQSEMMEVRLGREVEKSKSVLYKSRVSGGIPYAQDDNMDAMNMPSSARGTKKSRPLSADLTNGTPGQDDSTLSEEQIQAFETENADLLKHYEDQLDQVRTAERSILEISELHSTLHANLQQQSEHIDQLVQDSYLTTENLGKGNKELKRASERRSTAQAVFWGTAGFCTFLILWDFAF